MTSPLPVTELRRALDRLMHAVEEQFGEELHFNVDYYWNVPIPEGYDMDRQPQLDVGQVSDDVESVRDFAASEEFVSVWHECQHIAGVLRAIAEKDLARF